MSDSWLKLVGNILIATDEYVQFLKEQEAQKNTEPVHREEPKKNTNPGKDVCRHCRKDIYLTQRIGGGPYWYHTEDNDSLCNLLATPSG